ncbi:hypothetical protein HPP92_027791 [Vanilla planifolia]|uniref:BHLH domain-containing protein n=1 Tax=Vanilla planifolia TaxID=51239 RepID=A0A835P9R0_VANPL|nr:hypothetical protein HPP92_027791 [Vanilla planifolia]
MFDPNSTMFLGVDPFQTIQSYSEISLIGEELDRHRQFGQSSVLDPSGHGDASVFRTLSESFVSDLSSYGTLAMPTILYDPPVQRVVLNHNGGFTVLGGQLESSKMERRRKEVMRGLEEYGSQKNEKQRREFGEEPDRATIVSDTIEYIKELLRTVDELKVRVGKKRCKKLRSTKLEREDEAHGDIESSTIKSMIDDGNHGMNGSVRSSWIQRRAKGTFVDVRIVEDEAYIRLTQRRKLGCVLNVSKVLDELQLELLHLSGGNIGDCHVFMISAKVKYNVDEGAHVYASSVAKRFIQVMDGYGDICVVKARQWGEIDDTFSQVFLTFPPKLIAEFHKLRNLLAKRELNPN